MKKYELLIVLPGTLDDKGAEEKINEITAMVGEFGEEAKATAMGKNRLAYPIKQVRYGYFYTVIFSAEPANTKKIQEKLNLNRDLLRGIIVLYNAKATSAQKITYFGTREETPAYVQEPEREEKVIIAETPVVAETPATEEKPVESVEETPVVVQPKKQLDLKEIDKKLDEILADDNMNI
ncbi:MAG: 30S ribosomal protein S6 [Patescibacteria group bacterium]|nr:30S ribosomal protein S6 [Patescibacteria group bacterium]